MGFFELSEKRQSCRAFSGRRVEREKLERIALAGRNAPSACNSQPWRFVVVESPDKLAAVAQTGQQLGINGFLDGAQAFIVVLEEHAVLMPRIRCFLDSQYFAQSDIGQAVAHMCLMAADLDLGVCQIGMFDREKLCQILDLPKEQRFASLIAIGYPADPAIREKKRKPADEVIRFV